MAVSRIWSLLFLRAQIQIRTRQSLSRGFPLAIELREPDMSAAAWCRLAPCRTFLTIEAFAKLSSDSRNKMVSERFRRSVIPFHRLVRPRARGLFWTKCLVFERFCFLNSGFLRHFFVLSLSHDILILVTINLFCPEISHMTVESS